MVRGLSRTGSIFAIGCTVIFLQLIGNGLAIYLTYSARIEAKVNQSLLKSDKQRDQDQEKVDKERTRIINDAITRIVKDVEDGHRAQLAELEELLELIRTPPPRDGVSGAPGLRGAQGPKGDPGSQGPQGPRGRDTPIPATTTTLPPPTTTTTTIPCGGLLQPSCP